MTVKHAVKHEHVFESAGSLMERDVPVFPAGTPIAEVRRLLAGSRHGCSDIIAVTAEDGRFAGAFEPLSLLAADGGDPISTLMKPDWPAIPVGMDQEHAVKAAATAGVSVLVVVDQDRPVGLLPALSLLRILAQEHREDVNRMVGMMRDRAGARHALEESPLLRVLQRLPWLIVGLAMSSMATAAMMSFEAALQAKVSVAFFIPALVYIADAVGTQTEAIAVRGLPLRKKSLAYILGAEAITGALIGIVLGLIAFAAVWLYFGDPRLAAGVSLSLLAAGTFASFIGLLLPMLLEHSGIDPAFGSGPVATIIQDVLTIVVYFFIITAILGL